MSWARGKADMMRPVKALHDLRACRGQDRTDRVSGAAMQTTGMLAEHASVAVSWDNHLRTVEELCGVGRARKTNMTVFRVFECIRVDVQMLRSGTR